MRKFITRSFAFTALVGLGHGLWGQSALAADMVAAREKVQALCQVCHGLDGVAILTEAANLSGQQHGYIVTQLRAYRSGARKDPQMSIVAKTLTDADIENMATWYSSIKVTVESPK